jgi:hypothetical protein
MDWTIGVRFLAGARDSSCNLCVQTGPGAHPTLGTGGPFSSVKVRPGHDTDHSPLSSAEVENDLPPSVSVACSGTALALWVCVCVCVCILLQMEDSVTVTKVIQHDKRRNHMTTHCQACPAL